jgi:hypothetical protein
VGWGVVTGAGENGEESGAICMPQNRGTKKKPPSSFSRDLFSNFLILIKIV